jgi:hypothetical protein
VFSHNRRPVLLFDSNIWRYIIDTSESSRIRKAMKEMKVEIAIAPATVYEALRTKNPLLRDALIKEMTRPGWKRLMPEAFEESNEIYFEIKRLFPMWQNFSPNLRYFKQLRYDWERPKGGFWDRTRFRTEEMASFIKKLEGDTLINARDQSLILRKHYSQSSLSFESINLGNIKVIPYINKKLEKIQEIDAWRVESYLYYNKELKSKKGVYYDWLSSRIKINEILADQDWENFWFFDVNSCKLPYSWMRWATQFLHSFKKVNDGTPVDSQISTYTVSCTHFITADKRLSQVIDKCHKQAPFKIAQSFLIRSGEKAIEDILQIIQTAS